MSDRVKNIVVGGVIALLTILVVGLVATNQSPGDRVESIGSRIKCPVCQGESIADSPASMAVDMMALVEERVAAGASNDEIVSELLGSFTGAVLLDPPASGSTLLLWVAPLIALLMGIGIIAWWKRHPGEEPTSVAADQPAPAPANRRLIGGLIVIGGLILIVGVAATLIQDGAGAISGAAEIGADNLDDVSNETMEAVIAANLDNPEINGMRLALAERYFETGDYRNAFPHFLAVAESSIATDEQTTISLVRLGWMAYDGNGEVDTATDLLDQALALSPGSPVALYIKGQVLWCGADNPVDASTLFAEILSQPDLADDTRARVEADLALASTGDDCA
jgi:cytochrome c-type biogenesis protein CcmH